MFNFFTKAMNKKRLSSVKLIAAMVIIIIMASLAMSTVAQGFLFPSGNKVKIQEISANGYTFKVRTAGLQNNGQLIVFLHGFPESSKMWEDLMEKFAILGYRCIAPDQRGYSAGARPVGAENYTYNYLTSDVIALADAVGGNNSKFHLVGHDWGASVSWVTYGFYPDRIKSLSTLSTPHTQAYLWAFENDPEQIAATGYIRNYQTPGFEEYFAANDYALLRAAWNGFPQENIDDYLTIFSVPEARTATINWYRAIFLPTGPNNPEIPLGDVTVPTLYIWGKDDPYLKSAGVAKSHTYMEGDYNFLQINGAGHWLMEFNKAEVSRNIIAHIVKTTLEQ